MPEQHYHINEILIRKYHSLYWLSLITRIPYTQLEQYNSGTKTPSIDEVEKIAAALKMTTDELTNFK